MAYKQISPQAVTEGGTGVSANTAFSTICGGTTATGAIQNVSPGTNTYVLTSNGAAALPTYQLSNVHNAGFVAGVSSNILNVTGDGTAYTIVFDTVSYDRNGDYDNTTGKFTIPITGTYLFSAQVYLGGLTSSTTSMIVKIITNESTQTIGNFLNPWYSGDSGAATICTSQSAIFYLTAGTDVYTEVTVSNGLKVVDVITVASTFSTQFSGFFLG